VIASPAAWAVPLLALAVSALAVGLLARAARRHRWVDRAGDDPLKIHGGETPVLGGLGIAAGALAGLGLAMRLLPDRGALSWALPWTILGAGLLACGLGLRDDLAGLRPRTRLLVEIALGLGVGGLLLTLGPASGLPPVLSTFLIIALAVFYTVGGINAVNMQDGLDGLAGTLALLSCLGFVAAGRELGLLPLAVLALTLGAAIAGFLLHNAPPASIFMGDNGSYLLGLLLAAQALLVLLARPTLPGLAASVLLIGLPVLDAALAILRRLHRGVSPLSGDRDHLYDRLARRFPTPRVIALCGLLQAALVLAAVALLRSGR
jgi:UDP-GlcNAc:undecaprenyl-phosphate/decaprenyl-phosphate GlcNAc-1-phosphate transferase